MPDSTSYENFITDGGTIAENPHFARKRIGRRENPTTEDSLDLIRRLTTKTKALDQARVLSRIFTLEIIKKLAATRNHLKKTATRSNIVLVRSKVPRQVSDTLRQMRNLVAGATGIGFMNLIVLQIDFFAH